jgi:preprotein translocase subunit SecD
MKNMFVLTVAMILTACATRPNHYAAVALEFRLGSQTPGAGLVQMTVQGRDQSVYVSNAAVLSNADVASARVVKGPYGPHQVELVFTKAGAARFATITEQNIMKPLAILVDGQLISAPIVREKICDGKVVITASFSKEDAERIARGITAK